MYVARVTSQFSLERFQISTDRRGEPRHQADIGIGAQAARGTAGTRWRAVLARGLATKSTGR